MTAEYLLGKNDELSPTTRLIGKKVGKRVGRGETARLRVRNAGGAESAEFIYTRSVE